MAFGLSGFDYTYSMGQDCAHDVNRPDVPLG
jgi:hypothetical protein